VKFVLLFPFKSDFSYAFLSEITQFRKMAAKYVRRRQLQHKTGTIATQRVLEKQRS